MCSEASLIISGKEKQVVNEMCLEEFYIFRSVCLVGTGKLQRTHTPQIDETCCYVATKEKNM